MLEIIIMVAVFCSFIVVCFLTGSYIAFNERMSGRLVQNLLLEKLEEGSVKRGGFVQVMVIAVFLSVLLVLCVLLMKFFGVAVYRIFLIFSYWTVVWVLLRYICITLGLPLNNMTRGMQIILASGTTLVWVFWPSWLTLNITALTVGILFLVQFSGIKLKTAIILFCGMMLYDTVNVFKTGLMQISVDFVKDLPILLAIPSSFSLDAKRVALLGLGDVVLPGFMVMIAAREAKRYNTKMFVITTIVAYFVGLGVVYGVVELTDFPQPATLYLCPAVVIGFIIPAWRKGILKEVWQR